MSDKWATEKYAVSGAVVSWLDEFMTGGREEVRVSVRFSDRWSRRWLEWTQNPEVRIDVEVTLDGFLSFIGVPLALAPDELFQDPGKRTRKGKRTTPRSRRQQALRYAAKHGTKKTAEKFGVSVSAVRYWIKQDRIAKGESTARRSDPAIDRAARMRLENPNLAYREIERRTGVARTTIRRRAAKLAQAAAE